MKLEIIQRTDAGKGASELEHTYNLDESTICNKKNANKI